MKEAEAIETQECKPHRASEDVQIISSQYKQVNRPGSEPAAISCRQVWTRRIPAIHG